MKGRPAALDPAIRSHVRVPESVYTRIYALLYSDLEDCVPIGAYSNFVTRLMREWLNTRELDLTPFGIQGNIRGLPESIDQLRTMLVTLQRQEKESQ